MPMRLSSGCCLAWLFNRAILIRCVSNEDVEPGNQSQNLLFSLNVIKIKIRLDLSGILVLIGRI